MPSVSGPVTERNSVPVASCALPFGVRVVLGIFHVLRCYASVLPFGGRVLPGDLQGTTRLETMATPA